ncbi:MAG TPA: glycosyltransferase [Oxalicibacterium sp.]|nr:glycosyltransferase [Oxalicibacterium sp.]
MREADAPISRIAAVILTHNRVAELRRTLQHMLSLAAATAVVVVDNASTDDTAAMLATDFPQVRCVRLAVNIGAAARNAGVAYVDTPYVAFCDDDTWWADGALERAVALLDAHPQVAVLCARVLVGPEGREDPTCAVMAASPLPRDNLPGPALLGFLAGASVVRREAFLQAGGYEPRLFIGGEEGLLALDLAARGWRLVYAAALTVHHHPSSQRDSARRRKLLLRNALWICWMRMPAGMAAYLSWRLLRAARRDIRMAGLRAALRGLPWTLTRRHVVPQDVARWYYALHS